MALGGSAPNLPPVQTQAPQQVGSVLSKGGNNSGGGGSTSSVGSTTTTTGQPVGQSMNNKKSKEKIPPDQIQQFSEP